MTNFRLGKLLMVLLLSAAFSGCVTVPVGKSKMDIDKAVQNRVAAGLEYLQMGKPNQARRHLSRALELNDDSAIAQNAMALLYKYEEDPGNEEKHYKAALSADRHYSPAHNNYGTLLFEQGRYDEAIEQFRRAAEDPGYAERGGAYANMGRCYLAQGEVDEAKQLFLKSVRLSPTNTASQLALAQIYFRQKNFRLSADYYNEYGSRSETQSSEGLWLGIRLAHHFQNRDQQSSFELALQQLYPGSEEYRQWQKWKKQVDKDAADQKAADKKAGGKG